MKSFFKTNKFYILIVLAVTIISGILTLVIPQDCTIKTIFNLWCPGCGGTRMVKAMMKLDFYQAFRYNPLLFILSILGAIFIVVEIIYYIKKKSLIKISLKVWILLLIIAIIYMVLRNIPMFSYLIPTEV